MNRKPTLPSTRLLYGRYRCNQPPTSPELLGYFVFSSTAMTDRHFEHGELQLACRNSQLSLSLSSSFTLALPPLDTEPVTADDISHLSRTGQLWIAKANPCRLVVVSSIEGLDLDERALRSCIDSIIDCPVRNTIYLPSLATSSNQVV